MRTLNLGILAHIDAGKTSLSERLLFQAGVINEMGRVDDGSTQTDSLALERQRGITIKSAVASFVHKDVTINLIDTPGHPDFIAEVERVLAVLDGVVLVISAVEGVQAQTRVLMRVLKRLAIPTLIFVNKVDRRGAQYEHLLHRISEKLTPDIIAMGSLVNAGRSEVKFMTFDLKLQSFKDDLMNLLTKNDDKILSTWLDDEANLSGQQLIRALAIQARKASVYPVFFGSAITGAGMDTLMSGIIQFLPANEGDRDSPVSGTIIKIERKSSGEKIAYVRMNSGTVHVRDRLPINGKEEKITSISVFEAGSDHP